MRKRRPPTAQLTVAELAGVREQRAGVNHETYRMLWDQVQETVRARNSVGAREFTWHVPPLVPGRPLYDPSHAARYVRDKLRRGGFGVAPAGPSSMLVSWDLPAAAPAAPVVDRGHSSRRRRPASTRPTGKSSAPGKPSGRTPGKTPALDLTEATHALEKLKARLRM